MSRWPSSRSWAIRSSPTPSPYIVSVSKRTAYYLALSTRTSEQGIARFSRSCLRGKVTLIITRRLAAGAFTEPTNGDGDPVVVGSLREVQHGRHRMLLHTGVDVASGSDLAFRAVAALQPGSKLAATEQAAGPCNFVRLFSLPHSVGCVRDCLVRLDPGLPPGFSYLACAPARAAVGADARLGARPGGDHRSIPRSIKASDLPRPVSGRGHELGVLHSVCLGCDDTTTQLGVLTGGGHRLGDRRCRPAERQRLWRRDNPEAFRGFAPSWPLNLVIVTQSRCRGIAANRHRQPTCGSVDRVGLRNPSPHTDTMAVGTKRTPGGPTDLAAWFTWHRSR